MISIRITMSIVNLRILYSMVSQTHMLLIRKVYEISADANNAVGIYYIMIYYIFKMENEFLH
jgi:ABC-type multidrug transport system permease subunit